MDVYIDSLGAQLLVEGQQLIRRENMMAAPAHNNTSFAVIFSIGDNELVRFGRPSVFNIDNLARLISPVTMFDCQTLSLPRVDTPQPFIRSSIAFKYDTHPYGGLSMLMPMVCWLSSCLRSRLIPEQLLLPMCVTKCKLTRTVYSPDSQCTRWCAQCRTWVHQGCMDRAPPVPVSQRIAPFFSAPGQENAVWDALLVAPIVRIPRGGAFPPFSIELLIRDVRASGGRPANIEHWFAAYTHRSFAGLLLGNWTYYTCPGCEGRI